MADIDSIKYINPGDDIEHPFDALYLNNKLSSDYQEVENLVKSVTDKSTNSQYPSAKCLYDIMGDLGLLDETKIIYYTTTDENTITPKEGSITGSVINIVSNTYTNGVGKIIYDGDIHGVGDDSFLDCTTLVTLTLPNSILKIGRNVFKGCSNLEKVISSGDTIKLLANDRRQIGGTFDIYNKNGGYEDIVESIYEWDDNTEWSENKIWRTN